MKILFLSLGILISQIVLAQDQITVNEKSLQYSGGVQNAMTVIIPEADSKTVEKNWKKELSDWNGKMTEKKGEYFFDNCQLKDFGSDYFDVYTTVMQEGLGVRINLWIDLGGAFMNSKDHAVAYNLFSVRLKNFAVDAAKEFVQEQLDDANKTLSDLNTQQNDLVKENGNLKKQISDCEASIKQANADLVTNDKDQASKKDQIANQQKVIDSIQAKLNGIK